MNAVIFNPAEVDCWFYIWGSTIYTSKKAYTAQKGNIPISPIFKWMWKSCVLGKHKFFFWLLLHHRLNTRNLLRRKNRFLDNHTCVLCQQNVKETPQHLFFTCPFSVRCWQELGIAWDTSLPLMEMITHSRNLFGLSIFREVVIIAGWCI